MRTAIRGVGVVGVAASALFVAAASADTEAAGPDEPDWAIYEVGSNDILLTSDEFVSAGSAQAGDPASAGTGNPIDGSQTAPAPEWLDDWATNSAAGGDQQEPVFLEGRETNNLAGGPVPQWVVGDEDREQVDVAVAPYSQVVAIEATNGEEFWTCTGYLYGPNDVATAGHCIDAITDAPLIEGRIFLQLDSSEEGDVEFCLTPSDRGAMHGALVLAM